MAFVLAMTEELSAPVHRLALYVFMVIWQIFRRATGGSLPRVKAAAIERQFERNDQALARLEGAHARFLEREAARVMTPQPAVFKYLVETVVEAPDDPVEMTEEESGTLFLVLKTAIDVLHDAHERTE